MPISWSCVLSLVFAAIFGAQTELHTLTALGVQSPEKQHGCLPTILHVVLGFQMAVLRLLASCRVLIALAARVLLIATWPIALPFTQREVTCMMFQLQRGCPGVCTACQAL